MPTPDHNPVVTFRPGAALLAAMAKLKDRDGISYSEQLRRAVEAFLIKKQVYKKDRTR